MRFVPGTQGYLKIFKCININYHVNRKKKNHTIMSIDEEKASVIKFTICS